MEGALIRHPKIFGHVEIARSYSYKLNVGNYESRDFFCSQKAECAPEDAESVSDRLYEFCKSQVLKAVRAYREDVAAAVQTQIDKEKHANRR